VPRSNLLYNAATIEIIKPAKYTLRFICHPVNQHAGTDKTATGSAIPVMGSENLRAAENDAQANR